LRDSRSLPDLAKLVIMDVIIAMAVVILPLLGFLFGYSVNWPSVLPLSPTEPIIDNLRLNVSYAEYALVAYACYSFITYRRYALAAALENWRHLKSQPVNVQVKAREALLSPQYVSTSIGVAFLLVVLYLNYPKADTFALTRVVAIECLGWYLGLMTLAILISRAVLTRSRQARLITGWSIPLQQYDSRRASEEFSRARRESDGSENLTASGSKSDEFTSSSLTASRIFMFHAICASSIAFVWFVIIMATTTLMFLRAAPASAAAVDGVVLWSHPPANRCELRRRKSIGYGAIEISFNMVSGKLCNVRVPTCTKVETGAKVIVKPGYQSICIMPVEWAVSNLPAPQ
jgi:hypothetical protein